MSGEGPSGPGLPETKWIYRGLKHPRPALKGRFVIVADGIVRTLEPLGSMRSIRAASALWLLVTLAAAIHPDAASGQTVPSPYRFVETRQEGGVFVGYVEAAAGRFDLGPRSGVLYGARYAIDVSGPFGLEGAVSYAPTTRSIIDPTRPEPDRTRGEADVALLLFDVRLRFSLTGRRTWHGLSPFVFAGAGAGIDLAEEPEGDLVLREEDRFDLGFALLGALGGGVRWMIAEDFLLRGDAHLTLWQLDTPEGFFDTSLGLEAPPQVEWANNGSFSLGLAYRF